VVGSSVGESVIGGFVYGAGDGGFVSPASAGLAVDGGLVGSSVGCSVGEWECVGPAVPMMGAFEGFSVGDSVGMAVVGGSLGGLVGSSVGGSDGLGVGDLLGLSVGDFVGDSERVGLAVPMTGDREGLGVGDPEG